METNTHGVTELTVQLYRRDKAVGEDTGSFEYPYYYITVTSIREARPAINVIENNLLISDEHTFYLSRDFQPCDDMFTSHDYDELREPVLEGSSLVKVASVHIGDNSPDTR
tara:strand:+ start:2914 stop:3246 length:333 start_codon:yes stop_codon:yes gene_type:complete